ncbi:MAG TPA: GNAT family N-acetyltransferase [Polyangia bacterium]
MRIRRAEPVEARRQAEWIVAMEPWSSMGFKAVPLGRWLSRRARAGCVLVVADRQAILGILVFQPDFLLGTFIALLAVPPPAAGRGVGRALVERIERQTFARHRWLYVSSDSQNLGAARFYKKLGFARAARLSDLVCEGRTELLWRKSRAQTSA